MPTKKKTTKKKVEEQSAFSIQETPATVHPSARFNKKLLMIIGATAAVIIILVLGLYYYLQYQKNQQILKNPLLASQKEQETLIANVAKLTDLPNEQPTIAKVSDITKLQGQPFFQKAKNGDYVLIYSKSEEAILYDPTENKIVQIGPININQSSPQQAALGAQTKAQPLRVVIENGTIVAGLAKKTELELSQKMPEVNVVADANASSSAYNQTKIIDLTGNNAASAGQLATFLNGTVTSLPTGEVKPANADILIILGSK